MNLAVTLVLLLPLTPTGSMTLKTDHPRRVWELDETYHTALETSFRRTTWQQKLNYAVVLFCTMLFLETISVELRGRSHPAPKLYEGDLLSGSWTLWMLRVEGVQGFLRGSWLQKSSKSKVLTSFKGSRAQGFNLRGHGLI